MASLLPRRMVLPPLICAFALLSGCLDRNNPFDPINWKSPLAIDSARADSVCTELRASLESLVGGTTGWLAPVEVILPAFAQDTALHGWVLAANQQIIVRNDSLQQENIQIDSTNRLPGAQVREKTPYDTLSWLPPFSPNSDSAAVHGELRSRRGLADSAIQSAFRSSGLAFICPQGYYDSLESAYSSGLSALADFSAARAAASSRAKDSNDFSIGPFNQYLMQLNSAVRRYNDSLRFEAPGQPTPIVVADSLKAALDKAGPGDTLRLGSVAFTMPVRFQRSGTPDSPLVVLGNPAMTTEFVDSDVFLSSHQSIHFENIIFRGSAGSGVKLVNNSGAITFKNCRFENNQIHGLEVTDSEVRMEDCIVSGNLRSGIRVSGGDEAVQRLTLHNVLVVDNKLWGIDALNASLDLHRSTVAHNLLDGILVEAASGEIRLSNTILAYNRGHGLSRKPREREPDWRLDGVNAFGNQLVPFNPEFLGQTGTLNHDPEFLDHSRRNYNVRTGSPLAELERQFNIIIGWRGR